MGKQDIFISLPPTSPLRSTEDITACVNLYQNSKVDGVITYTNASRNPYFNMISFDSHNYAQTVIPKTNLISRRQDAPEVYDLTTVAYVMNPEFVLSAKNIFEGKLKGVFVPKERAIDIDDKLDFQFAEFLMRKDD